ncbi:MAG: hypothetical protein ACXVIT_12110 [Halobacteriota archaeon]
MTRKDYAKLCIAPILTAIFAISLFILIDRLQVPSTTAMHDRTLSALSDGTISVTNSQLIRLVGTCYKTAKSEEDLVVAIIRASKSASQVILGLVTIQLIVSVSIYQRYRNKV